MTPPQLTVGLIGAGAISWDRHLPGWTLVPEARVIGVADVDRAAVERLADEFKIPRRETDYRALLDDPAIDVVDVCVPSALHAEIIIAALSAGKHVLCEKPMATCRADAAAVLEAAARSGRKLMIAQQMRFDPLAVALHAGIGQLGLGQVYYARAQWLRRRRLPGRPGFTNKRLSGGGPLYDLGVHVVDLAWWLMGCPRPLKASGGVFDYLAKRDDLGTEWGTWNPATIDVEDFAAGLVRFEGGSLLALEASWLGFQAEQELSRVQLFGSQGGALWPDGRLFGERQGKPWDVQLAPARLGQPHAEAIRGFAHALLHDEPVPIPPEQSAIVIAILEALYRSADQHAEVSVDLF